MADQLDKLGLPWSFFDARTTPPIDIPYDEVLAGHLWGQPLTPGELGCYASHYELWKSVAAEDGPAALLVLEDDIWLDPTFFAHHEQLVEAAQRFGYLRLCATVPTALETEDKFLDRFVARVKGRCFGTQAYLMTRAPARRLLASVTKVIRPIDDELDRYWVHGVPNRVVYPFPVLGNFPIMASGGDMNRKPMQVKGARRLVWKANRARDRLRRYIADLEWKFRR
jgi:glycosyl transferase family 25